MSPMVPPANRIPSSVSPSTRAPSNEIAPDIIRQLDEESLNRESYDAVRMVRGTLRPSLDGPSIALPSHPTDTFYHEPLLSQYTAPMASQLASIRTEEHFRAPEPAQDSGNAASSYRVAQLSDDEEAPMETNAKNDIREEVPELTHPDIELTKPSHSSMSHPFSSHPVPASHRDSDYHEPVLDDDEGDAPAQTVPAQEDDGVQCPRNSNASY
jgi:hypothetical protein